MNERAFVKIPTAFILASAGRLSSNAFRVLVAIKMHARKDPSVQTIAKEVGLSKRTVERAIAELRENGLKARGRGRATRTKWTSSWRS